MKRETVVLLAGFALCAAVAGALAGRDLEQPGLYYDEVIQADPTVQLLDPDGRPPHIPGARSVRVLGRWAPLFVQPYMGALKSWTLVPVFALFGAAPETLRLATLALGLAGVGLTMLWARRVLSLPVALLGGAFLAVDPSLLFVSRHDWGSVALALVCRASALCLLTSGILAEGAGAARLRYAAGGLCLGLGLYNKIDFAVPVLAAGLALALAAPRFLAAALRAPSRAGLAAAGALVGAAPLLATAGDVLGATRKLAARASGGDLPEKLDALRFTLDGSYFHRLMLAGGSFEDLAAVEGAATGVFLLAFAAAVGLLAWRQVAGTGDRAERFVLLAALLSLLGVALLPRGVRVHHVLNAWPFPHLAVAAAVTALGRHADWRRLVAAGAAGAVLAGSVYVDLRTLAAVRESGGKGRWSDALGDFARELAAEPGAVAVSLDWGFDGPLRFAAPGLATVEPVWRLRAQRRSRRRDPGVVLAGTPRHVYLAYEEPYAVFDFGPAFLARVRALPPGEASIRRHDDRAGDPAFYSVRFARPHELVYRGTWEIRIR